MVAILESFIGVIQGAQLSTVQQVSLLCIQCNWTKVAAASMYDVHITVCPSMIGGLTRSTNKVHKTKYLTSNHYVRMGCFWTSTRVDPLLCGLPNGSPLLRKGNIMFVSDQKV